MATIPTPDLLQTVILASQQAAEDPLMTGITPAVSTTDANTTADTAPIIAETLVSQSLTWYCALKPTQSS